MRPTKTGLKSAIFKLKALHHDFRFKICQELAEKGEMTVTQLYIHFRCDQSFMSQHLAILRNAGYLNTRRVGKEVFYVLNDEIEYIGNLLPEINKKNGSIPVHQNI